MLAPTLLVARPGAELHATAIAPALATKPLGRALLLARPAAILDALGARRCAIALHADLELEGEVFPAIVLAVLGRMATAVLYARVERTDYGNPALAAWQTGALGEPELFAALGRALLPDG